MHTYPSLTFIILLFISIISIALSLTVGSVHLHFFEIFMTFLGSGLKWHSQLIWQFRLPRCLSAYVTGGLLALAGGLLQILLRNPIADPYILGVSGGAALGSLVMLSIGLTGFWLNGGALVGALSSMFLVFILARDREGALQLPHLLLTGVIVAAGWAALISLILSLTPNEKIYSMLFWLMGDLSFAQFPQIGLLILVIGLGMSFLLAPQLNILARGELQALSLGVNVRSLKIQLYFISALLTAAAVTLGGNIGFIGLIIPHMVRICGYRDYRILIPAVTLVGGSFLVLADTLARVIAAPMQLPVGTLTALLGVPIFLFLLRKNLC